jgi:hypothetical protein
MESVFKYELENKEIEDINNFCNSAEYCSAEQYIGWCPMFYQSKICYFYLYDETGIKSFSRINEKLGAAQIFLGPVCCDKEIMVASLTEIIEYYKKKHYYYLGVQMYYKSGYDTDYIEYLLNKKYSIKYFFKPGNTQTSIEINLEKSVDDIWKLFREDTKRNIKKALKLGVTVDNVRGADELDAFIAISTKMYKARNIPGEEYPNLNMCDVLNYLIKNNRGQILVVKDKDGIMLGGIITVYQGKTVRMYKGASDPDRRDIPISHLQVFEIIQRAKNANFKYLDLWGYNHFVDKNDQVYNINAFKRGFGGDFTFFAKKMNVNLIPNGYYIYIFLQGIKSILAKLHLIKT